MNLRLRDEQGAVLECELSGFPVPQDDGLLGTVVRLGTEEMLRSARQQGTQLAEATLDSISEGAMP